MYKPTSDDYALIDQPDIILDIRFDIKDSDGNIVDSLQGVVDGGTLSIDADSDVRRTTSIILVPIENNNVISSGMSDVKFDLSEKSLYWINKTADMYCGLYSIRNDAFTWYKMGVFEFQDTSISFDSSTNQMSINCSDLMTLLDGTLNGQMGQLTTTIPAYSENPDTGEVLEHNYIRAAMAKVISQLGGISNYLISDIGEFKGMPQYNTDYETYRTNHPLWDSVPYDLEYDCGCTVLDIVTELRDLYPNYEAYFDEEGTFMCQMIPSCYYDDFAITDDVLQKYLVSEDTSRDYTVVKNVTEVWGQVLDVDYYSDSVTNSSGCYTAAIDGFNEKYYSGDKVGLVIPSTNIANQTINISSLGAIPIYNEDTDTALAAGTLEAGKTYVFECKRLYTSAGQSDSIKFYYLGEYQVHAMCVLTDGTVIKDGWTDPDTETKYDLYSQSYFKVKYNCANVEMNVIPDSPFTIQKIGVRLDVKTGDDYENITSDSLAIARAHYENWISSRLTDNITITTAIMPWVDVNTKVAYRMQNSDSISQYIVKSVSHDFTALTTQMTLMTFYPLYEDTITG